jgi:hypothetical protein
MSHGDQLRWWFVVVATAIGLITMHSLVGYDHDQGAVRPPVLTATAAESSCCNGGHSAPAGTDETTHENTAPHHDSSLMGLLHLCLAVLTGFTLAAIAALLAVIRLRANAGDHLPSLALLFQRTRSPPPTSARLAQLCVLRC